MITNLIVIAFILLSVFWFSTQGLFSAILHLIVLLCAGALALAAWEPLAVTYLLNSMPEYAWGVALLVPFALFLLIGRIAIDMLVPGNMQFHPLVNNIGGGAIGFVIGMITAGIVIIGVQFIGPFSSGYEPFKIENGKLVRANHLWLGADDFADSVFMMLSSGAFYPMNGNTLSKVQPGLAQAAGAYHIPARDYARTSLRPANVELTRRFTIDATALPKDVMIGGKGSLVAVTTNLNLAGTGKVAGAADQDGVFTATPAQVCLLADDGKGHSLVIPASGFVTANGYGSLTLTGEYARTKPAVDAAEIDWIFDLPTGMKPAYLRIKQLRLPLADVKSPPQPEVVKGMGRVQWKPAPATTTANQQTGNDTHMGPQQGVGTGTQGMEIEVTDKLPVTLSDNWLSSRASNVETRDHALISAEGMIQFSGSERVDRNLAIDKIEHPENQAIVRVKMTDAHARSFLGKVLEHAGNVLTAPNLVADDGTKYSAIGYVRYNPKSTQIYLNINATTPIRSMSQIDINRLADGEDLYLYFRTGRNIRLTKFICGGASEQNINVTVP